MSKIKTSLILFSFLLIPVLVFAQPGVYITSLTQVVNFIQRALWVIFGGLSVVAFVIAGMLFLFAQGDPEKVKVARTAFIWGVVGVVVGILAYSILAIVTTVMSGGI